MVDPKPVTENFSVSPQISQDDFSALAAAGYKTIINNRPDNEEPGQMSAATAQALAAENGLNYVHIPVKMPEITSEAVEQFEAALEENPGPFLAHCKSGTRSSLLWTIAKGKDHPEKLDELMQQTAQQGYDLSRMRSLIEQHISAS